MAPLRYRPTFIELADAIKLCGAAEAEALDFIRDALADGRLRYSTNATRPVRFDTLDPATSTVLDFTGGATLLLPGDDALVQDIKSQGAIFLGHPRA